MKIDVIRKLPEVMETVVILQSEASNVQEMEYLPPEIRQACASYIADETYKFSYNSVGTFHYVNNNVRSKIILCGAGDATKLNADRIRTLVASFTRTAKKLKSQKLYLFMGFSNPISDVAFGHVLAEASLLTMYRFNKYLSDTSNHQVEALHLILDTKNTRHINKGIVEGRIYAEACILARNLVNEPANVINPESLAEHAKKAALEYGFPIDIFTLDKLKRIKMDAFLAVGRGSKHDPRLIVMRYNGNPDNRTDVIGLIGKGLTYDSGGYCIKTPQGMVNMKNDMGGSAAVIGAFAAISTLKLKVNVVGVIAACENMISGDAYRAGDILRSMSGKTIEVINTDAEGRLTLADAIHYAIEREHVTRILDIATLTGAAVAALGTSFSAVLTNDNAWLDQLKNASEFTGELIWELPAHEEYRELIKSEIADLKNTGGAFAGAITAGLFLREFVEDKPWIHIDIAGSALKDKESGIYSYGATGVGVRLITQLLKLMEKE